MPIQKDVRDVYFSIRGDYELFRMIMIGKGCTDMECLELHQAAVKEWGWIDPSESPVKRSILVVLAIEVGEEEDDFQTAELAVELLSNSMDNKVTMTVMQGRDGEAVVMTSDS